MRREGYLAGADAERLLDLNAALQDDRIDGIWCVRGGYGAMRILAGVDYDAMGRRPKTLIGYSDITALHAAFATRADVVTFHGPTARGALTEFQLSLQSNARSCIPPEPAAGDGQIVPTWLQWIREARGTRKPHARVGACRTLTWTRGTHD